MVFKMGNKVTAIQNHLYYGIKKGGRIKLIMKN